MVTPGGQQMNNTRTILPNREYKNQVHQLEDAVLCLEAAGQTEQDIFSLVNMILRGFIVGGELTPEYIALANQAIRARAAAEADQEQRFGSSLGTGLVNVQGNQLK